jgi:hypothetical protein
LPFSKIEPTLTLNSFDACHQRLVIENNYLHSNKTNVIVHFVVTMRDLVSMLKEYCTELGADPSLSPDAEAKLRLPIFLSQLYEPFRAKLFGREMYLMMAKQGKHPTPAELENHLRLLKNLLGLEVVFVLDVLPAFDRSRLLKRSIPFIVPHRQMFLPGGTIELREVHSKPIQEKSAEVFSMPTQLMLLHHLQKRAGNDVPFALYEWATALGYSRMSISRAHKELLDAGMVDASPLGKTVTVRFAGQRRDLWERALPMLRSPVQQEGYFRVKNDALSPMLEAGLTALAHYSDLADSRQRTLATWRMVPPSPNTAEPVPYRDAGTVLIQRWWYPPVLLAEDERTVDRLSLFLSLRESADERIQSALAQLLEGVKW